MDKNKTSLLFAGFILLFIFVISVNLLSNNSKNDVNQKYTNENNPIYNEPKVQKNITQQKEIPTKKVTQTKQKELQPEPIEDMDNFVDSLFNAKDPEPIKNTDDNFTQPQQNTDKINELIQKASNYEKKSQYDEAIAIYKNLLKEPNLLPEAKILLSNQISYCKELKLLNSVNKTFIEALNLEKKAKYDEAIAIYAKILDENTLPKEAEHVIKQHMKYCTNTKYKTINYNANDTGDYLSNIKSYCLWTNPKQIKVYINPEDKFYSIYKSAFDEWDIKTEGLINFAYVNSPKNADIYCYTTDQLSSNADAATPIAITMNKIYEQNNKYYCGKTRIEVLSKSPIDNSDVPNYERKKITSHEIAHALGLKGHSTQKGDVLYYSTETIEYKRYGLSTRDINTIKKLYTRL